MLLHRLTTAELGDFATLLNSPGATYRDLPEVFVHDGAPGIHGMAILCPPATAMGKVMITSLEQHPHSAQTFIPMSESKWLVCLVPSLSDGAPDTESARIFLAGPDDAICIHRNVWHAGLTVFGEDARFAMTMWRADAGDDGIVHQLTKPLVIEV